jgi:hypothetical protein
MDYAQPPQAILTALVNHSNGTVFTPEQLVFGLPEVLLPTDPRNTKVLVTASDPELFTGTVALYYDRLSFATLAEDRSIAYGRGEALKVSDLLPVISARYGVVILAADIVDQDLPAAQMPPVPQTFTLQAAAGSLLWVGQATYELPAIAPQPDA